MLSDQSDVETVSRSTSRPGGRAARIQAAVLKAVEELKATGALSDMTVPVIAARAGVTPSTIYRRWGSLPQLLAEVAVRQLQPDADPPDTGDWRLDLTRWLDQFVEEMASEPGRALLRDMLGAGSAERTGQCADCVLRNLDIICARAIAQGDLPPNANTLLDQVIAPVMYRILFTRTSPGTDYARMLLQDSLQRACVSGPSPIAG